MERFEVNIGDRETVAALRHEAETHGRSIAEEIKAVVAESPRIMRAKRGEPKYPPGCEPLPGESFVDHIVRISRPGFDIDEADFERDRTPHHGFEL